MVQDDNDRKQLLAETNERIHWAIGQSEAHKRMADVMIQVSGGRELVAAVMAGLGISPTEVTLEHACNVVLPAMAVAYLAGAYFELTNPKTSAYQ